MTKRWNRSRARPVLVTGLALTMAGCASYRAVSAAGDLGLRVGAQQGAITNVYGVCLDSAAIGAESAETCGAIASAEREETAGMRAIAAYGAALKALSDGDDPDVDDNVSAAFHAMPEGLGDAALPTAGLVASLTAFVTQSYHRGELREVIDRAHPTVVALCSRLESVLILWKDSLIYTRETALREMERLSPETEHPRRLALVRVAARARTEQRRIEDAFRAVRAFNAAHATLQQASDLAAGGTFMAVVDAAFRFGSPTFDETTGPENPEGSERAVRPTEAGGPEEPATDDPESAAADAGASASGE
ncbi:MAG: hypothetical protein AB8I08_22600 [Sandaracinaceae bacterium]